MRATLQNIALFTVRPLMAAPARAQVQDGITGVMDRPRPDYDAKGIALGSFRLKPALDVGASYDDNVYATPSAPLSDFYVTMTPSCSLVSD